MHKATNEKSDNAPETTPPFQNCRVKRIPLLPHIFDACFRVHTILFNKKRSEAMDIIESTVSSWNGISVTIHKYGGVQFNYKSKEIGHMHGNGMVDILLDRKTKKQF